MKKEILICLMIIMSSCTLTTNSGNEPKLEKEIYTGTQGIILEFLEKKPSGDDTLPEEVFENEDLSLSIKLTNKGPYPVRNARLLMSLEKGFMEFSQNKQNVILRDSITIDGKTIFDTFDYFTVIQTPIKMKELDKLSEYHDSLLITQLCYDYRGIGIADVCIDTDPHDVLSTEKACSQESSLSLSDGQGGPVAITSIEPRMLVDNDVIRPQFKIHIRNTGQGTVLQPGSASKACNSDELGRNVYNSVILKDISFSNYNINSFECLPNELVLRKEEDFIICTLKASSGIHKSTPSFKTPLKIEIEYGYTQSISKELRIKKILTY